MSKDQVIVSGRTTPYCGYMRVDHYRLKHTNFKDGWSKELSREVLERGHAVAVLPYDPSSTVVVLIEQFRIGGYTAPKTSPWQIECIAGIIEPHQLAVEAAHREASEEAGLRLMDLEPMHTYLSSPGCTSETIQMFCGHVDAAGVGGVHGLADEGEYIRVFSTPLEQAFSWLASGRIENGMTIIALQWLKLNLGKVHRKWGIKNLPNGQS